jgi:hypothetical protein
MTEQTMRKTYKYKLTPTLQQDEQDQGDDPATLHLRDHYVASGDRRFTPRRSGGGPVDPA